MRRFLVVYTLFGLLFARGVAAHDIKPERHLLLQIDEQGGALLLRVRTSGPRGQVQWAMADVNRDGVLDAAESAHLALTMLQQAMAGLRIERDGVAVSWQKVHSEMEQATADGTLIARALLSASANRQNHHEHWRIALDKRYSPVVVQIQATGGWYFKHASLGEMAAHGQRLAQGVTLQPGTLLEAQAFHLRATVDGAGTSQP